MQFHVEINVLDTLAGKEADRQLRDALGRRLPQLMDSGKVWEAGFLAGMRGSFFLVEIDAPEDLYSLMGPEIYGHCSVQDHPIIPLEKGAELFQQWAEEDR